MIIVFLVSALSIAYGIYLSNKPSRGGYDLGTGLAAIAFIAAGALVAATSIAMWVLMQL